jgi:hypothetical protein
MSVHVAYSQKIDRKRPVVYLEFEQFIKNTSEPNTEGVRLTLRNNSIWPIYYSKWLNTVLPGDVAMAYVVQLESGAWAGSRHVDVVTRGRLLPGKSATFIVPTQDLLSQSQIYVEFYFSWELQQGQVLPRETIHRAYISTSDFPGQ